MSCFRQALTPMSIVHPRKNTVDYITILILKMQVFFSFFEKYFQRKSLPSAKRSSSRRTSPV